MSVDHGKLTAAVERNFANFKEVLLESFIRGKIAMISLHSLASFHSPQP